jgi:CheY-like chemotaxis protein
MRVRVIHWKPAEAEPLLEALRGAGATPEYDGCGNTPELDRAIRMNPPDVVVIDLSRLPSHGRMMATWLRRTKALRDIPLLFANGAEDKIAKLRETIPDAHCTITRDLKQALAQAHPSTTPPRPVMAEYQARTAAQKLGLDSGGTIAVIDPPRGYLQALGTLPDDAELVEDPAEDPNQPCDTTLWFIHEPEAFLAALRPMWRTAGKSKLWILWRKGSTNGITQNSIREACKEAGLVDCKICSVNKAWSGMLFTRAEK